MSSPKSNELSNKSDTNSFAGAIEKVCLEQQRLINCIPESEKSGMNTEECMDYILSKESGVQKSLGLSNHKDSKVISKEKSVDREQTPKQQEDLRNNLTIGLRENKEMRKKLRAYLKEKSLNLSDSMKSSSNAAFNTKSLFENSKNFTKNSQKKPVIAESLYTIKLNAPIETPRTYKSDETPKNHNLAVTAQEPLAENGEKSTVRSQPDEKTHTTLGETPIVSEINVLPDLADRKIIYESQVIEESYLIEKPGAKKKYYQLAQF